MIWKWSENYRSDQVRSDQITFTKRDLIWSKITFRPNDLDLIWDHNISDLSILWLFQCALPQRLKWIYFLIKCEVGLWCCLITLQKVSSLFHLFSRTYLKALHFMISDIINNLLHKYVLYIHTLFLNFSSSICNPYSGLTEGVVW